MEFGKWIKRQMASIAFATASVEKNALSQGGDTIDIGVSQEQRHKQGMLSDALVRGELTQEVKDLRWRMYKVMRASEGVRFKMSTNREEMFDENGEYLVQDEKSPDYGYQVEMVQQSKMGVNDIKVDSEDTYEVLLIVENKDIAMSGTDTMFNVNQVDDAEVEIDEEGSETKTIGELDVKTYLSQIKSEKTINVERTFKPKFEIENFCSKLVVRKINDTGRLLEFYISKYPKEDDVKTAFLLSEIKKAINNPRGSDMLDIDGVSFITDNTVGAFDLLLFYYKIKGFDKIIEFNGNYVIKFVAEVEIDGEDLIEQFREEGLDKRYENKERKD
jgi:hypothetical protein